MISLGNICHTAIGAPLLETLTPLALDVAGELDARAAEADRINTTSSAPATALASGVRWRVASETAEIVGLDGSALASAYEAVRRGRDARGRAGVAWLW